ncbi:SDR family oxidoreductase [Alphaproteobacteria bacterium]|nr:SDR family oxidoreductase [Alphaproteobacteria bacterium]
MNDVNQQRRTILVTGGTKGIGAEVVRALLVLDSFHVIVCARSSCLEFDDNPQIEFHRCDFRDRNDLERMVRSIRGDAGHLFGLVNNVAAPEIGLINETLPRTSIENAVNVNVFAPLILCQEFVSMIDPAVGGVVVNVSGAGAGWRPGGAAKVMYHANKVWLTGFTEAFAQEVRSKNIQCYGVSPTGADTALRRDILRKAAEVLGESSSNTVLPEGNPALESGELIARLLTVRPEHLSGRLISTIWDDLDSVFRAEEITAEPNFGFIRRIDGRNFAAVKTEDENR